MVRIFIFLPERGVVMYAFGLSANCLHLTIMERSCRDKDALSEYAMMRGLVLRPGASIDDCPALSGLQSGGEVISSGCTGGY